MLTVALRDPSDLVALDELAFAAGMKIEARVAPEILLRTAIANAPEPPAASVAALSLTSATSASASGSSSDAPRSSASAETLSPRYSVSTAASDTSPRRSAPIASVPSVCARSGSALMSPT